MRHFLTIRDFTKNELLEMVELAKRIKNETKRGELVPYLNRQRRLVIGKGVQQELEWALRLEYIM